MISGKAGLTSDNVRASEFVSGTEQEGADARYSSMHNAGTTMAMHTSRNYYGHEDSITNKSYVHSMA